MSIHHCQLHVRARRALTLPFALAFAAGCAGGRAASGPDVPEPVADVAPIDLITNVPTPTNVTSISSPSTPVAPVPEHVRDVLDPANVREEFTHLFALDGGDNIPPALYRSVLQFVEVYSGRARDRFAMWLAREGKWGPMIRAELRQAGLPEDLVYLSLVESGFSNTAVSRARAVGMWQFMEPTARTVGLRIDEWVDERRDPQLATRAAIRHLAWLYSQTDDWALAAAAYNAGLGRVTRIQQDAGENDYFRLVAAGRLPAETRNYVPAITAAALIAHNRDRFGLGGVQPEAPFAFEWLEVEGRTRLSAVAKAVGSSERVLRELNPQLLQGAAPPGGSYRVRIPAGSDVALTAQALAGLPESARLLPRDRWVTIKYTVKSGDGWGSIAQRHHTTIAALRKQNPRAGKMLHPGMRLSIRVFQRGDRSGTAVGQPAPPAETRSARADSDAPAATSRSASASASSRPASHKVKSGETMSGIAQRYDIALSDLARWNGMSRPRPVRTGERLRLRPPAPVRHRVTAGESLSGVARKYDVAVRDLMKWNRITTPRGLRIGETLIVSAPN